MYVTKCKTFPDCIYTEGDIQNFIKPKRVNRMTIWETNIDKEYEALAPEKYVMVVYCKDDNDEDDNLFDSGYCVFDTSVNIPGQTITLVENEPFYKYAVRNEKGIIKIDLKGGRKIQNLNIDIMIFSGDITFDVENFENTIQNSYHKYYLSNKIFYHFNIENLSYDNIELEYIAQINSFFNIKYSINSSILMQIEENILSDENYLVQIDPTLYSKTIYISNYRVKKKQPFFINFYSLNCELEIRNINEDEIYFFEGYAQEVISKRESHYSLEKYEYKIKIKEADLSNYNHKMCMLYVNGYETPDSEFQTEIVIGENINQNILFENEFKSIRFLYPLADPLYDLAFYINIIEIHNYQIKIFINTEDKPFKEYNVTKSGIYYLESKDIVLYCEKDTLCNIIIEISVTKIISENYPIFDFGIRQIKNTPSYFRKNQIKKDFTCGDRFYYLYTDIGKNEKAEIVINFLREVGYIAAKVVRKDQFLVDEEANWRGTYRMPSRDWEDSIYLNLYNKNLEITPEYTQDCIEGCYLLLSIQKYGFFDYVDDSYFLPFSIIYFDVVILPHLLDII